MADYKFLESFARYAVKADMALNWASLGAGVPTFDNPGLTGRPDAKCVSLANYSPLGTIAFTALATMCLTFRLKVNTYGAGGTYLIALRDSGANTIMQISITSTGTWIFKSGNGATTYGTTTEVHGTNVWKLAQIFVTWGSPGVLAMKLAGAEILNITPNLSAGPCASIIISAGSPGAGGIVQWTDLAVADNWTGDVRLDVDDFNGPGDVTQFIPTGAATNWQAVTGASQDGDTSYNESNNAGDADNFTHTPRVFSGRAVRAVQVTLLTRKTDAGSRTIQPSFAGNVKTAQGVPDSYGYKNEIWSLNPATGLPWTEAEYNAGKPGYVLTT